NSVVALTIARSPVPSAQANPCAPTLDVNRGLTLAKRTCAVPRHWQFGMAIWRAGMDRLRWIAEVATICKAHSSSDLLSGGPHVPSCAVPCACACVRAVLPVRRSGSGAGRDLGRHVAVVPRVRERPGPPDRAVAGRDQAVRGQYAECDTRDL